MSNCKFKKLQEMVSYDGGNHWVPVSVYVKGEIIEYDSPDCADEIYRWIPTTDTICIEDSPTPPLSAQYLTIIAQDDITVTFTPKNSNVLSYSKDNGTTWTQGNTIAMNDGDEVMLKGTMIPYFPLGDGVGKFSSTGNFTLEGNIMSLLFGDNFEGETSLSGKDTAFAGLFGRCIHLQSIDNLVLPATTLTQYCYSGMFGGCTSLTKAPQLPAPTLDMGCYMSMFSGCTSLQTAPDLPATTLADMCYGNMFKNCSNLNYVKCLATDITASNCTANWLYNVASGGTFVKDPSMIVTTSASVTNAWKLGSSGVPSNWSVQDA